MRVTVARGEEAALALLDDPRWNELVRGQPRPNPTLLGGWQRALMGLKLGVPIVIAVEHGAELVAGGPFGLHRALGGRLSYATWLGRAFQPFSPDVIARTSEAVDVLVDALLGEVDIVRLWALAEGSTVAAVERRAPWGSVRPAPSGTLVVELPTPTRPRLLRSLAKDERRASRAGVRVETWVTTDPEAIARALERLFRLHRERWWGDPQENANFSTSAETRALHRNAVAAVAREGRAQIVEIAEDGRLVASHLSLLAGRGGVAYTMAMRRGKGLASPGHRAYVVAIDELQAAGCEVVDIGGGTLDPASPKGRLKPTHEPFVEVFVAASPRLQRMANSALAGRATVRRIRHPRQR